MSIAVGDTMPVGQFLVMTDSGPGSLSTDTLFGGKKVVFFALPGAFTPTCSKGHLPGYIKNADLLRSKGIDTIACMAVNDVHVMNAWGKEHGAGDKVLMLADGNADYARALGLDVDLSAAGMGQRSQRFALVVDDGVVTHVAVEVPREFKVSKAEAILELL